MNPPPAFPPPPFPNPSSFTFLHLLRPQNPNRHFFPPHHDHYHPPSSVTTSSAAVTVTPPQNPPDLSTALSTLKNLIHLSETTIRSIYTIFPTTSAATTTAKCPFNLHHRISPESLFSHSFRCPSSPFPNFLSSLNQNQSMQTLSLISTSDFFYQDCPAVVTFPPKETTSSSTNQALILPEILSNSIGELEKGFPTDCRIRFLASEIWSIKRETEAWNDYPTLYSRSIHRAILCFCSSTCRKELIDVISRWTIVNSPCYGVVIDVSMRDHILLLLKLCLKAITSEAIGLVNTGVHEFSLKCPVLSRVLLWFGTQLSILYGEVNGKLFAIHIFKQLILNSATNSLMFSEEPVGSCRDEHNDGVFFVSQVAAAVAAFNKRSLLEEKIKAIRYLRQLNNSQRMAEHEYVTKRADEERQKRADYRPILEHDVLLWQRAHNQETNILKSREDLLAEERDYKRRRTSYRGKKMKRTTTQVMRDIIEEYMEEIKAADGFVCSLDETEEAGMVAPEPIPVHGISADNLMEKGVNNSSEVSSEYLPSDRKQLLSHKNTRFSRIKDEFPEDFKQYIRDSRRHHDIVEDQYSDRNKNDREYYSKIPEKQRTNGVSCEQGSARGQRNETEVCRKYTSRSPERNYSRSHERTSHGQDRVHQLSENKARRRRTTDRSSHRSDSVHHEFEDRYDPSESRDMYEGDLYSGSKYVRPD